MNDFQDDPILGDFRNFLYVVWTEGLNLPEPTELQYDIAWNLQHGYEPDDDGLTRIQLQASRHFGKTYILCAYVIWLLLRNPDDKILFISMNQTRASEAIQLMRQMIDAIEMCAHLRPTDAQRDSDIRFEVGAITRPSKDPSVAAYGIFSAVAGTHPRVIIADDCETKENSLTVLKRERLWAAFMEFENMINPGGIIIHMGTPQSGDSVYNRLAESYHLKRWPDRFYDPEDELAKNIAPWYVEKVQNDPNLIGKPANPLMFGEEQLLRKQAVMGDYHYDLQMRLSTKLADADKYPLKLQNLVAMGLTPDQAPKGIVWGTTKPVEGVTNEGFAGDLLYQPMFVEAEYAPYERKAMYVDPAGSGSDLVGYAIGGTLNGFIYLLDAGGLQGGHSDATLTKLAKLAQLHDVHDVVVESNFGDGLYEKALGPIMARINGPTQIRSERAKQQRKEDRIIDILGPVMAVHRLVIDTRIARKQGPDELLYQLTHVARIRGALHEDGALDATAGLVAQFMDTVGLDPELLEAKRKKAESEKIAKDFEREFHAASGRHWFQNAQVPKQPMRPKKPKRWLSAGGKRPRA